MPQPPYGTKWASGPGVAAFNRLVGMPNTVPGPGGFWGLTTTTSADQVQLIRVVAYPNAVLTAGSRAYLESLMRNVTPSQRWGVSGGVPVGVSVALKNGWLPNGNGWEINSIGHIVGQRRDYVIAVLTSNNPFMGYGITSIEGVSSLVWRGLPAADHTDGSIWQYLGQPITGWRELDHNLATVQLTASGGHLYQLHTDGTIWQYLEQPITGWRELDHNPVTVAIVADGDDLLPAPHGWFDLAVPGGSRSPAGENWTTTWLRCNSPASGGHLYQLHTDGTIWQYLGQPITGWRELDHNPVTVAILADGDDLYQLHIRMVRSGSTWGQPITGWRELDHNLATVQLTASGGHLYQLHTDGTIWQYLGQPITGWRELDHNPVTVAILADGDDLYQLHIRMVRSGSTWGQPITGWRELDDNPATSAITASEGTLYELH